MPARCLPMTWLPRSCSVEKRRTAPRVAYRRDLTHQAPPALPLLMRRDYKAALAVIIFLICYVPGETLWHWFKAWSRINEEIRWSAECKETCRRFERELLNCEIKHA